MKNMEIERDPKLESLMVEGKESWDISSDFSKQIMFKINQYDTLKDRRRTWFFIMTSMILAMALMIVLPMHFSEYASMVFIGYLLKIVAFIVALVFLYKLNEYIGKKKFFNPAQSLK